MAYVGTLATPRSGVSRASGLRSAWSLLLFDLSRQLAEARRDLAFDQALNDLDRRQRLDIGVSRDAC